LNKHGKVAKVGKTGVRRVLLDYIDVNTIISVMFMLSPAAVNVGPTTKTLESSQYMKKLEQEN
jgi:hypothetical protein